LYRLRSFSETQKYKKVCRFPTAGLRACFRAALSGRASGWGICFLSKSVQVQWMTVLWFNLAAFHSRRSQSRWCRDGVRWQSAPCPATQRAKRDRMYSHGGSWRSRRARRVILRSHLPLHFAMVRLKIHSIYPGERSTYFDVTVQKYLRLRQHCILSAGPIASGRVCTGSRKARICCSGSAVKDPLGTARSEGTPHTSYIRARTSI